MIHAVHGFLGAASDWNSLIDGDAVELAQYVDRGNDLPELARLLNVRIEDLQPVLLGYSMGARIALHQLLDDSRKFSCAVLVAPHFGLANQDERNARLESDARWAEKLRQLSREDFLNEWNSQPVFAGASSVAGPQIWNPDLLARMLDQWSLGRQDFLLPRLHEIRCPLLWLVGEKDQKFQAIAQTAAAQNPLIRVRVVPGAGHRLPWEAPEAFRNAISSFIRSQS